MTNEVGKIYHEVPGHLKREDTMTKRHLPTGYMIREMAPEEFRPFFAENRPKMFAGDFSCLQADLLTEQEKAATNELAERMGAPYRIRLGVFFQGTPVGWSTGLQTDRETFYMINSAIFPEHRQKGLYQLLLGQVVTLAAEQGFQLITSRHIATNSAILIPKLKAGFVITGFELSDTFGMMVTLTYHTNPLRRRILDFRAGQTFPDPEIRRLFGL
jgi:hypothetical protein